MRPVPHRRTALSLFCLSLLAGCADSPAAPEEFSTLEPEFFAALNAFDSQTRPALPRFAQRMRGMAEAVQTRLDRGELTDEPAQQEAGRALLYAAFPHIHNQHLIEDGFASASDIIGDLRLIPGDDNQAELLARMRYSAALLQKAQALRPKDDRLSGILASTHFNQDVLVGKPSEKSINELLASARSSIFGAFTAVILLRDPELHPLDAPYMKTLRDTICDPKFFDCDRMGPPPPKGMDNAWLTTKVTGPAMMSDLLVRWAESLLARADADPAGRVMAASEALGRLMAARGFIQFARFNASLPAYEMFPAPDSLPPRQERIERLLAAAQARLSGSPPYPGLPEATGYYRSRTYRDVYQCAACHIPRPDLTGIPR
jgi:hypothetical protein